MAYESRVFVVDRNTIEQGNNAIDVYADKIADIKMACMGAGFSHLFRKEIDYTLYVDNADEPTRTDKYGDTMTCTDIQTVVDYLEQQIASGENYRRLSVLLGLLKGFDEKQWNDLQVVHYGY